MTKNKILAELLSNISVACRNAAEALEKEGAEVTPDVLKAVKSKQEAKGVIVGETTTPPEDKGVSETATPTPEPEETPTTVEEPPTETAEETAYTKDDVQKALLALSKNGKKTEAREIIKKRGVDMVSQLDPADYGAVMQEIEALNG